MRRWIRTGFAAGTAFKLDNAWEEDKRQAMDTLNEWLKYWRKLISKCSKIHKDSRVHRRAYAELSEYLNSVEESAKDGALDATVLWAVKFMQRMHELEKEIGVPVLDKKVYSTHKD